jgi:ketosteroid isomerase-like protein
MATTEEEVKAAIYEFYGALDDLLQGRGTERMANAWHHDASVTTVHPFGMWSTGWDEVWATWEEGAAVFSFYQGHKNRNDNIGGIHDLKVSILGDAAYGASVFKSRLYLPDGEIRLSVNCTNIVHRRNGAWKLVHHHPDQAPPDWQAAIARMVEAGKK